MCIICYKPATQIIEEEVLRECFIRNPDGAGLSFVHEGALVIEKGIKTSQALIDRVKELMDKELVIHCRIASPGMVVNEANCHPFYIKARVKEGTDEPKFEYAISHNGRLEWGHTNDKSDTNLFTEQFLTPMFESHPYVLTWEWGRIALERTLSFGVTNQGDYIGRTNKMVVMMNDKKENNVQTWILNEHLGNWHNGIWFSNKSWDVTTRPVVQRHDFFPNAGKGGGGATKSHINLGLAEVFRWYCEPDAQGWFWCYGWDAWVNAKTGAIVPLLIARKCPDYVHAPGYNRVDLAGRANLTLGEINHLLSGIYEAIELGKGPPEGKGPLYLKQQSTYDPLGHLTGEEKSLICKKAYDVLMWAGEGRKVIKTMDAHDKVKELRSWIKSLFSTGPESFEIDGMTCQELDGWIIKKIKEGALTIEKINDIWAKGDAADHAGQNLKN